MDSIVLLGAVRKFWGGSAVLIIAIRLVLYRVIQCGVGRVVILPVVIIKMLQLFVVKLETR